MSCRRRLDPEFTHDLFERARPVGLTEGMTEDVPSPVDLSEILGRKGHERVVGQVNVGCARPKLDRRKIGTERTMKPDRLLSDQFARFASAVALPSVRQRRR